MFSIGRSVYQRVLGSAFDELSPSLRRYFGPIAPGAVGRGEGVYDTAGSRLALLRPVLALLARRDVLFPERGHDVPFRVENRPDADGLAAVRTFRFPHAVRRTRDRMEVRDGRLVDRIGRRGGLEVTLDARVRDGGMRLTSTSLAWRVRSLRVPLPHLARVTVDETASGTRQRVDVRIRVPVLGEVFRYAGEFSYRVEPAAEDVGDRP